MNPFLGIALKVLSALVFTVMAACVKLLSVRLAVGELVFFRSLFALLPLVAWLRWCGEWPSATRTRRLGGHVRRGFVGASAMFLGFGALSLLSLPDATALGYTAPLITVALAAFVLGERVRVYRWSAVGVGFLGVLVMLWPQLAEAGGAAGSRSALGVGLALLGAVCVALATVEVRRLTETETTGAIVFYFSIMASVLGLSTLVLGWTWPTPFEAAMLVVTGILGGVGQILLTNSYQYADTSLIAPSDYTTLIWSLLLGWFVFGELPGSAILAGGAIVVASGLFVIWREHKLGLERRRQRESAPQRGI